jgi:hypothetical protein
MDNDIEPEGPASVGMEHVAPADTETAGGAEVGKLDSAVGKRKAKAAAAPKGKAKAKAKGKAGAKHGESAAATLESKFCPDCESESPSSEFNRGQGVCSLCFNKRRQYGRFVESQGALAKVKLLEVSSAQISNIVTKKLGLDGMGPGCPDFPRSDL